MRKKTYSDGRMFQSLKIMAAALAFILLVTACSEEPHWNTEQFYTTELVVEFNGSEISLENGGVRRLPDWAARRPTNRTDKGWVELTPPLIHRLSNDEYLIFVLPSFNRYIEYERKKERSLSRYSPRIYAYQIDNPTSPQKIELRAISEEHRTSMDGQLMLKSLKMKESESDQRTWVADKLPFLEDYQSLLLEHEKSIARTSLTYGSGHFCGYQLAVVSGANWRDPLNTNHSLRFFASNDPNPELKSAFVQSGNILLDRILNSSDRIEHIPAILLPDADTSISVAPSFWKLIATPEICQTNLSEMTVQINSTKIGQMPLSEAGMYAPNLSYAARLERYYISHRDFFPHEDGSGAGPELSGFRKYLEKSQ